MSDCANNFEELCGNASRAFLQSVVVIDNEAQIETSPSVKRAARAVARSNAPGGLETPDADDASRPAASHDSSDIVSSRSDEHRFELDKVARAFAEKQLTCGVYLPNDDHPADSEDLICETFRAIFPTDACILDWQLRAGENEHSIKIIEKILEADVESGGRLRLIIIYTAEDVERAEVELRGYIDENRYGIKEAVDGADVPLIEGNHFRIVFLKKPTRRDYSDDPAVVHWKHLAERTIEEFTALSKGLLRAYALQSVAAIRRDMHHILAQFDPELDTAFAVDRAIKPDPADAGRLIEEVLLSELNQAIARSKQARSCLGKEGVSQWLEFSESRGVFSDNEHSGKGVKVGNEKIKKFDRAGRRFLVVDREPGAYKSRDGAIWIADGFYSSPDEAARISAKLATLSTISRHRNGLAPLPDDLPRLKLGSVIEKAVRAEATDDSSDQMECYLCIQPLCDTVRITSSRSFLMVQLIRDPDKFQLVLELGSCAQYFRLPKQDERVLKSVEFPASPNHDSVVARGSGQEELYFVDSSGQKWRWLADLREMFAVSLGEQVLVPLGRTGLNSLEWLRLRG